MHYQGGEFNTPGVTPLQGTAYASSPAQHPPKMDGGVQACVNDQAASKDSLGEVLEPAI